MTSKPENILLFGATGVIGQFILHELVRAKSSFKCIAIFTSPSTLSKKADEIKYLRDLGVEILVGDVQRDEDVLKAYKQQFDTVVSAVGRNIIEKQIDLIRLAEESQDVKRIFPSEYGTDIEYYPESKEEKTHQQKLKVRAYIRDHVKRLEHTYVVTGPYSELYIGSFMDAKAGTFGLKDKRAVLMGDDGKGKVGFTTMPDVGRFVIAALTRYETSRNKTLKVQSFVATPSDILAEFERQTNAKWDVSYCPLDQLKKYEQDAWEKGNPLAGIYTLRRIWTQGGTLYSDTDNKAIGVTKTDLLEKIVSDAIREGGGDAFCSGKM